jgi:hypothetical protein
MIEIANGTLYLRANVRKPFKCYGIHFDAVESSRPVLGHLTITTLTSRILLLEEVVAFVDCRSRDP